MKNLRNQTGAAHLMGLLAIVLIAVIGFVGYKVWHDQKPKATTTAAASTTTIPTAIKSTTDLDQASTAINNLPVDSSLDPSQLDSDISQLQ